MRIAYIISAYKYPEQLVRLVSRLHTNTTSFLIHIDKKADEAIFRQIIGHLKGMSNVIFLNRHTCYWGGFGHVRATLEGIRELLRRRIAFDYVVLLTGQDYPIKRIDQIERVFCEAGGLSFMGYSPFPVEGWQNGGADRIEHWYCWLRGRCFVFPGVHEFKHPYLAPILNLAWSTANSVFGGKRRFPAGLEPFGGSSYWCLSRECIQYVDMFVREHPAFVRYFKYVWCSDELFFQTIILNSVLKNEVVNENLRYVDWTRDPRPAILTTEDFDRLATSPQLFARKFDATVDANVLDRIDREILGLAYS